MDTLVWILVCGALGLVFSSKLERAVEAVEELCESGQYTNSGECCIQCPPGEGVIRECGAKQTECSQCLDSETFSENYSHTEKCATCSECTGLMRMQTPCTDSNDAVCICNYSYFLDNLSGQCKECTVCPKGHGVLMRCEYDHDTVCEECIDDTFSEQESSLDPCLPCAICEEDTEILIRECTPTADAYCHDPSAPTYPPTTPSHSESNRYLTDLDVLWSPSPGGDDTTPKPSTPHFIGRGLNENLIPIYCSILAAVVVGLLAYIIFKRWNSCKQNKQAANNRAATANQTPSPEGEKLHSDSGISVDSQSLQEQLGQTQAQAHTQLHAADQIVVRVDGGSQPDSPPPQA
ncbi:Tumor necrosis factor receptor superfamily member 16 [Triplophysa tibetana]|uniref:Tumor necrosis factor receptor superfamily member 16 n=1 Tax=Triplophysa tibetana TaxID=1572043 RepID=A0A5A9N7J0_9TELE|nr:Tumor necrosis factor receptor superfamily member 16 [Triplophysa tibetana]